MTEQPSSPQAAIDPSAVDPAAFAQSVAQASDDELAAGMQSEYRDLILSEIFRRMEEHIDPERARAVDAVIHWKILDRPGGGIDHYEVAVRNGECLVSESPAATPRVTFEMKPVEFLRLVTGVANGPELFMQGRLKIEGDVMFAAQIATLFRVPTAG